MPAVPFCPAAGKSSFIRSGGSFQHFKSTHPEPGKLTRTNASVSAPGLVLPLGFSILSECVLLEHLCSAPQEIPLGSFSSSFNDDEAGQTSETMPSPSPNMNRKTYLSTTDN